MPECHNLLKSYVKSYKIFLQFLWFSLFLTFSVPESLKSLIFEIPIIPQTLNINNYRVTNAKYYNLDILRKFIEYSLKNHLVKKCLLLLFSRSRYCCSMVGRYYDPHSRSQGEKKLSVFTNVCKVLNLWSFFQKIITLLLNLKIQLFSITSKFSFGHLFFPEKCRI